MPVMTCQGQKDAYLFSVIPKDGEPPAMVAGVFMAVQSHDPFGCSVDAISVLGEMPNLQKLKETLVATNYSHLYLMPEFDSQRRTAIVNDLVQVYHEVLVF